MIRMRVSLFLLAVLTLGFSGPGEAAGQIRPGGPPGQGPPRQELERRVMQGLARMVQDQLALSQDELMDLQESMQSFREDRRTLAMNQASLRHALRDPTLEEISEEKARELLAEMVRLQEEELALYRKEQGELLTVLSPQQLIRFYHIRDEWGRRIQQLRQGRGPGGRPGGSPLNPGGSLRPGGGNGGASAPGGVAVPGAWLDGWLPLR